jgi:hypothetical protein
MKVSDVIFLSLSIAFLIIGIHQTMTVGFGNGYWALMVAMVFFFVYNLRRRKS